MKVFIQTTIGFFLIFFIWIESYQIGCISLLFPAIMIGVVSYGYYELKMHQRRCFAKCYLKEDTFASKIFVSKSYFILLFYTLLTTAMATSTFIVAIEFTHKLWLYFIMHILLSLLLFNFLSKLLKATLKENYHILFAREWTINIMAIVLMGVFTYITLNSYTPEYLASSLQQTIANAMIFASSNCEIIDTILKYIKVADSTFWWIVNESTNQTNNTLLKTVTWLIFILYNSLALLGINRFIIVSIHILSHSRLFKTMRNINNYGDENV